MLMIYTHLKQQGRCPSMLCRSASEALQFNQASYPRLQASLRCTAAVRTEAQHTVGPKVELVGGVPTVVERVAEVPTAGSGQAPDQSDQNGSTVQKLEINNWGGRKNNQTKNNFKIVFLGKSGVGKTSITLRFCRDVFQEGTEATIGASFLTKVMPFKDRQIKFEMWDTAGQERYKALAPMYYRYADAAVLVYDITDEESFNALKNWHNELKKNVDCLVLLVGNKMDLSNQRRVDKQKSEEFAQEKRMFNN